MAANRQGLLHRALTVGDLRKAMEHLDDDMAVRVGAVTTGVLPDVGIEVLLQAVAEGGVEAPGRGVDPALVLLIGLHSVPTATASFLAAVQRRARAPRDHAVVRSAADRCGSAACVLACRAARPAPPPAPRTPVRGRPLAA
ncbi:hypothetical protein [Streptomyces sp. URMC 123]|uniref:hypothetical protein n=1 Tax=Streptomyces sp. URMC 123 TaxID=3423403 RepID=UPI003F1C25A9